MNIFFFNRQLNLRNESFPFLAVSEVGGFQNNKRAKVIEMWKASVAITILKNGLWQVV